MDKSIGLSRTAKHSLRKRINTLWQLEYGIGGRVVINESAVINRDNHGRPTCLDTYDKEDHCKQAFTQGNEMAKLR